MRSAGAMSIFESGTALGKDAESDGAMEETSSRIPPDSGAFSTASVEMECSGGGGRAERSKECCGELLNGPATWIGSGDLGISGSFSCKVLERVAFASFVGATREDQLCCPIGERGIDPIGRG